MKSSNIIVKGRVQGVGFRYHTTLLAKKYEIKGWVKNLEDGSVRIVAQGNNLKLSEFKREVAKGNFYIKVTSMEESVLDFEEFYCFEIKY